MAYHEAQGPGLKAMRDHERSRNVHHLRIHAAEGASPESKAWLVSHHYGADEKGIDDAKPDSYRFDDAEEALQHIAKHSAMTDGEEGE